MRTVTSALTGILACLALPLALASTWSAAVATDTDRYVETVAPLASEPAVQEAAERRIADVVLARVDRTPVGDRFGDTLATVVTSAVRQVVDSPPFARAWRRANRVAHAELVRVLEDEAAASGEVSLRLGAVVGEVLGQLGLPDAAASAPEVSITVLRDDQVARAADAYRILDRLGAITPVAWVVLVVLTLLLARRRLAALTWLGVGSLVTSLLLVAGLRLAESRVAAALPDLDRELAGHLWRALTSDLRENAWTAAVIAAVVAVVAALLRAVTGRFGRPRWTGVEATESHR